MFNPFKKKKTKEELEIEAFTTKLVKTIVSTDHLKQLIITVKKQWAFEELQAQRMSYPILQDLMNTAQHGILIDVYLADGSRLVMKQDPLAPTPEEKERMEALRRQSEGELF